MCHNGDFRGTERRWPSFLSRKHIVNRAGDPARPVHAPTPASLALGIVSKVAAAIAIGQRAYLNLVLAHVAFDRQRPVVR